MAVTSRGRAADLLVSKKWKERETSPERTKVWTEPPHKPRAEKKVPVVYYLTRNGQLEHPHFMEVPLSSPEGLYLRDVINRLNILRGKGMASMYSWSSKRSYKNGFVWHDLAENDFIYPAHGQDYVLKGSELLDGAFVAKSDDDALSSSFRKPQPPESQKSGDERDFPVPARRRNQSWNAIDFHEYKVYKTECTGESSGRAAAADASTQTDDKRRRRRAIRKIEEEEEEKGKVHQQSTELCSSEISPPPSDSSPETLETLMKSDGRVVLCPEPVGDDLTGDSHPSGRLRASSVLMQLISCGSISFRDCGGPTSLKGQDQPHGFSLISHYKARLPRGGSSSNQAGKEAEDNNSSFVDKEYFSGSLIETKKDELVPALKRSSSYNADRTSHMELTEKEMEVVRAKCLPRKPKTAQHPTRKDSFNPNGASSSSGRH
ncbi:hypothetical protein NMG60_11033959 [Bertholletia excelsa]